MGENNKKSSIASFDLNSKFTKVLLILLSVFLIFAGPTYVSYLLFNVLNLNYIASIVTGFVLFIAGLVVMWFLIRKKIIT